MTEDGTGADGGPATTVVGTGLGRYLARLHRRLLREGSAPTREEIDGTLVFADVSGFTPLTERLARRGKVGAEELTDVLNDVFGSLLDRAADFGGDLLKFGGDALLLFFDGPGHEARACAAALAMQSALAPFRHLRTAGGPVSLRMSVGVNSGPVQFFLVGRSHHELLVAGPTMSLLVALESAADAGEVLVGPATAAAIEPRWLRTGDEAAKGEGRLLRRAVRVLPPLHDGSPEAGTMGSAWDVQGIPVALRDHLARSRDEGEHRVCVLTFLQYKGVDTLLESDGPAVVADVLDRLVSAVQESCERHGARFLATDLDADGGKVLLVAGAPTGSEDDEDRTIATLLDVLEHTPPELRVRAGVNRGRAFAVDIGNASRRTYAVMGDPTNLAARVMGKAEPGTLVATEALVSHLHDAYDVAPLPPFLVKGKSQPIAASVIRRAAARAHARTAATALVGRKRELAVLERAVRDARRGHGHVVELVAEPGMGKSRLVEALRELGRGLPTVTVEAAHYASASPYLALRSPLRRAFTGLEAELDDTVVLPLAVSTFAPHLEPYLPLLGSLFGLQLDDTEVTAALDPDFRRPTLHRVATELLTAALPGPALVVVEDAHWLDEPSADLLTQVLAGTATHGWAVCVTRRPGDAHLRLPAGSTTVDLTPIGVTDLDDLLGPAAATLAPTTRARLLARSGGNPLFLKELAGALERGHDVDALPDSIESLIAARIDTLPLEDRTLLRQAAVLGGSFPLALLAALVGADEASTARSLRELRGFVEVDEGTVRFPHALIREAAYEGLPYRRRRSLHEHAGSLLEQSVDDLDDWADLLSLHFSIAGDDVRTLRYARSAGDRARSSSAPVEALTFYRRALDAARRLPEPCSTTIGELWERIGEMAEACGRYADASAAYAAARKLVADPVRLAELHRKEGWVRERSGRYADALRWYTRGRRALDGLDADDDEARRVAARLDLATGAARLRQGRYVDGLVPLADAATAAEALDDRETLAHAYYLLDWAHTDLGNEERHQYRELSLPIYEALGNLARQGAVCNNLGIDAYFEGRWDEAVAWYERARAAWERAGDVVHMAIATNNLGEVASDRGRLAEADALFEHALQVWRTSSFPAGLGLATSNLGRSRTRAGRPDEATALLDEARRIFQDIGADSYVIETDVRHVERLVAAGQAEAALALGDDIDRRQRKAGGLPLEMLPADRAMAYAEAQLGRVDDALRRLDDVVARAREQLAGYEVGLTLEAVARVRAAAGLDGADAAMAEAVEVFDRLGVVTTPADPLSVAPAAQ